MIFLKIVRRYIIFIQNAFTRILYFFRIDWAPLPRSIQLEITTDCNLDCFMCSRVVFDLPKTNMTFQRFKEIINKLPKLKQITMVGAGEPFSNPQIFEIMDYATQKNIRLGIVTNATMLTEAKIDQLPDGNMSFCVSIDSPNPEKYKKIRGANLGKVVNNLKKLKLMKKNILLVVQMVVMGESIEELSNLVVLAHEIGADFVSFIHPISYTKEVNQMHACNYPNYEAKKREAEQLAQKYGIKEVIFRPASPQSSFCKDPWFSPQILVNGDILACGIMSRANRSSGKTVDEWYHDVCIKVPLSHYKMGNILEGSFRGIWNGPAFRALRKQITSTYQPGSMSSEELNEQRKGTDTSPRFSYCAVCLYRWSCCC